MSNIPTTGVHAVSTLGEIVKRALSHLRQIDPAAKLGVDCHLITGQAYCSLLP